MHTYLFICKHGSGVLTVSAESEDRALKELEEHVLYPDLWRLDEVLDEEEKT